MIRVGIGGWSFDPWRAGVFYPKGLAKTRELAFASERLNTIEINATYHRTQSPASFRKWASETPDDFVFSVKASRFATNRRVLAEAAPSVKHFIDSGIVELGAKLGPILWQFAPAKRFDSEDFTNFLELLPPMHKGVPLRHAIEARHPSFATEEFVMLARKFSVAVVLAHSEKYPLVSDATADFVYVRLECSQSRVPTGYASADIKLWASRARLWESGKPVTDLPLLAAPAKPMRRDVFLYVISGAKERNPAAATAILDSMKA